MRLTKLIGATVAIGAVVLMVSACQKKEETPGPAESMGKQIDSVVKNAGEQAAAAADKAQEKTTEAGQKIDKAMDDMKEGAKDLTQKAGEKMEAAGQKIQGAAKETQK
ncbi:hypothetical protein [Herbaspirillum sp. RV1423]|uniref:hypothetical protein n=1 Tax=Herbaspirillum sp. RV1423 TaxID=1443993 RepID=UPI000551B847|nr:hypothetical protein [Herbaspirillum sp. RV1423]